MLKVNLLPLFLCLIFYYHNSKVFAKAKYPFPPPPQSLSQFPKLEAGWDTSPLQGDALSSIAFHQTSLERGTVRVNCFVQERNTLTQPSLKPRPLFPEFSALIIRPLYLPNRFPF